MTHVSSKNKFHVVVCATWKLLHKVKITECVVSRVLTAMATFAIKAMSCKHLM